LHYLYQWSLLCWSQLQHCVWKPWNFIVRIQYYS